MARKTSDNQRMKERRRNTLLEAALVVFTRCGFCNANIDQIAKQANCSHGLIYYYFKSKEEIFLAIVDIARDYNFKIYTDILDTWDLTASEKLFEITKVYLKALNNSGSMFYYFFFPLIAIEACKSDSNIAEYIKNNNLFNKLAYPYDVVKELIEEAQKDGEIIKKNSETLTSLYMSVLQGLALQKLYEQNDFSPLPFELPAPSTILNMFK